MRRLANLATNFLLILGVAVLLAVLLGPIFFGLTFHAIVGSSMEPTIKLGSVVGLVRIQPQNIQVDDVIAFRVDESDIPVTHRVIERLEQDGRIYFRTKGDNNEDPDSWLVKPDNVLGEVVLAIPYIGRTTEAIREPLGFLLLIGFPATMVVVMQAYELFLKKPQPFQRQRQEQSQSGVEAYLFLFIGLAVIIFLGGITARNSQAKVMKDLRNFHQDRRTGLYVAERELVSNGSLPLTICLSSPDPQVTFSEEHFQLAPAGRKVVTVQATSPTATTVAVGFFPLLPETVLYRLYLWNPDIAPFLAVAIPILPVVLTGFFLLGGLSKPTKTYRFRRAQRIWKARHQR
jgi:signal peptidase